MLYPKDPAVKIDRQADAIVFQWKATPGPGWLALILVGIFLVAGIATSMTPLANGMERSATDRILVIVVFGCVIAPILYMGVAHLLNGTIIRADRSRVVRTLGPIWWSRKVDLPAEGIKQFFAVSPAVTPNTQGYSAGSIYAIDASDHVLRLATALPSSFAANQICHELEDFYGIEDMPVYGVTTNPGHPGPRV